MKKHVLAASMLLTMTLLTACNTADSVTPSPAPVQDGAETEMVQPETEAPETEAAPEDHTEEETEEMSSAETISFIVDVTDNLITESNTVIGNAAATAENYIGIMEIHLDDALAERAKNEIETGKTYLFTIGPAMTMSIPPQVTALDFAPATDEDLARLEEVRAELSNFQDCMTSYESMSLEQIIQDANLNYALWTQEEIKEFIEFITQKGYTEDSEVKSYVNLREDLGGSLPGAAN